VWLYLMRFAGYLMRGSWRVSPPIRHLFVPALMYAVNPLIMFVALQVPLMVIGGATSMAAVVAYTTLRTMARLPLQVSSQISFSLYTEYTRMHSSGQFALIERLYRKSVLMILGLFAATLLVGEAIGPTFYEYWLHRVPQGFHFLFAMLFIEALFESMMRNKISLSSSLNIHARDTMLHLGVVSAAACAMYLGGQWFKDIQVMLAMSSAVVGLGVLYVVFRSLRGNALDAKAVSQ
jgi:O-antigen/teichoic acid export membrane protein